MAGTKPKSKLAYLSYDQIQPKIDNGILDEYDMIFEPQQKIFYILDKEKNIIPAGSRLDSYQSVSDAETALNTKTNTYVGQIVSILTNGEYIPYSVNLNSSTGTYYVVKVDTDDYDNLINKPIENIVANDEVILSNLDDGFYSLVGNFRISNLDTTHRIATTKEFIIKQTATNEDNIVNVYITEISGKNIQQYICTDVSFVEDRYLLFSELGNEVDDIIQVEVPLIIQQEVPQIIDDYVDTHSASTQDIQDLFNN